MDDEQIRVGLIGAGGNVRSRHIPGFQGADDCEIVAVANRSIGNCWKTTRSTPFASAPGPTCTAR